MTKIIKHIVIYSIIWKLLERIGNHFIQFVLQLFLARLLSPEEYGIIALVSVFILLAQVFVQSGFNTALIQKKNTDDTDFSSILFLSLFVAFILYISLFIFAPSIANFYGNSLLTKVIRVLSLTLFFGAFNSIQVAFISKNMLFKKLFTISLIAIIFSGIFGILLAYNDYGVWALVGQQLSNQIFMSIIMLFSLKWKPKFLFSFNRIRFLFSYAWKLLTSSLINTLYINLYTLIIGKLFNSNLLGLYSRGDQFPKLVICNINDSIQSVMLPTLSEYQDDKKKVKEIMRRSIVTTSFIIFPIMVILAVIAEPLVIFLLTEKWIMSVPFLQIFCFSYALMPIHTANLQAINAMGRSDIFLKLEIYKKIIGLSILFISVKFGIYAMAWGIFLSSLISSFINAYPNLKLLNYRYIDQIKDILPSILLAIISGAIVFNLKWLNIPNILLMVFQIVFGFLLYFLFAFIFKLECLEYISITIQQIYKSKGELK